MLAPLAVAIAMVFATVTIHGLGLFLLARALHQEVEEERAAQISAFSLRGVSSTLIVVLGLFFLHGLEIWLYAAVYLVLDALPDLETAVYFSTITYSTIGYDDEGLAVRWQLVAAIEGINGVLLMGWTTAFFISLIGRFRWR
ncbi:ion channel [Alteraurantiacibacter aquimixticola]|uniref:Two pore domain potassium channel family protein n=1 Tax=Alteraurantiacibacter aquimixticola TaxID=2489173 RepID=A0A4T3F0N4_9SPHN|nr:ion channel [Alteraurantiacibacter aquimixticola]TIX49752.1 two pore domain potassium channel family protein [Alteraurantiacibacter aquimixticola]